MPTASPLKLKNYFFPYVRIAADAEYEPSGNEIQTKFDVQKSVEYNEAENIYQVAVQIKAEPENEESKIPYSIDVVAVGLFTVDEDFPEPERLLNINGASILYTAAREFIITITSRGPWSQIITPTISFYEPKDKAEEEQ